MSNISLKGINKADVLAALYNSSRPLGMGFMHYDPKPMTRDEAQAILDDGCTHFDYLNGRVMKIDLSGDELDPRLYDRDNGPGAATTALLAFLNGDSAAIELTHSMGILESAKIAQDQM